MQPGWRRYEMHWDITAFEVAWAEGAALSTDGAIAYAQHGRGERKWPSGG
jgi:hypothetical protein